MGIYFNANNLSLIPCHRTCYPQYVAAYFLTDEEKTKIIGIKPHNLNTYITIRSMKDNILPKCSNCPFNEWCMKGCLGANYESTSELFLPPRSVCKMFKAKFVHIAHLLYDQGIYQCAVENQIFLNKQHQQVWDNLMQITGVYDGKTTTN